MKNIILIAGLLLFVNQLAAQSNEIKARAKYKAAQTAYEQENYRSCLELLSDAES